MGKASTEKVSASGSVKKMKELWAVVEPKKLKEFFEKVDTHKGNSKWSIKGATLTGRCRFKSHGGPDTNPSMKVFPNKGYARCMSCGGTTNNLASLTSDISGKDYKTSLKEIQSHFNARIFKKGDLEGSENYLAHAEMKKYADAIFNAELVEAAAQMQAGTISTGELYFAEDMLKYLDSRDPLFLDYAETLPIGIFTTNKRIDSVGRSLGIRGSILEDIKKYLITYMHNHYLGALTMTYHESPDVISRFRLRRLDSVDAEGVVQKEIVAIDDPYVKSIGIFGLGSISGLATLQKTSPAALVMEGEFDALSVMVKQKQANDPVWIPLCHSGNANNHKLTALTGTAITEVCYVPDNDAGGIRNAKNILTSNPELDVVIFNWPLNISHPGGGNIDLHESITSFGYTAVSNALHDVAKNYAKREAWTKNRLKDECRTLDVSDKDDLKVVKALVLEYSECIGDIDSQEDHDDVINWISETMTGLGISSAEISKVAVTASSQDDPEKEFVKLLTLTLESKFCFIAYEQEDRKITLWDRDKKSLAYIRTGSESVLKSDIGSVIGDIVSWVGTEVPGGIPKFVLGDGDSDGSEESEKKFAKNKRSYLQYDDLVGSYIRLALRFKLPSLHSLQAYDKYTEGHHWLPTTDGYQSFLVNGKHLYHGTYTEEGDCFWEELSEPIYEKYYFELSKEPWSKYIKSVKDLQNAPVVPLHELLEINAEIINTGWTFQSQDSESIMMGAWATLMTISKIFPNNLQFLAANERGCGKSSLLAELYGGGKGTHINITEHAQYVDNATPAGLRQGLDGSARTLIIDEFDNQKGAKGTQDKQEEVLTMLRASSGGDGIFIQGSSTGKVRKYRFSVPTMLAGIDPEITDANQTRFLTIDLKSGLDNRLPPQTSILQRYSEEEIQTVCKHNTLATFRYIPQILRAFASVRKDLQDDPDALGVGIMQRYKDSLSVILSIIRAAYPDVPKDHKNSWVTWGTKICESKKTSLKNLGTATSNAELVDAILNTQGVEVSLPMEKKLFTVLQLLSSGNIVGDPSPINDSNVGIWLQPVHKNNNTKYILFIHWKSMASTLLKFSQKWKQSASQLKLIASRYPDMLSDVDASALFESEKGIPGWLGSGGTGSYSVLDVSRHIAMCAARENAYNEVSTDPGSYVDKLMAPIEEGATKEAVNTFNSI